MVVNLTEPLENLELELRLHQVTPPFDLRPGFPLAVNTAQWFR